MKWQYKGSRRNLWGMLAHGIAGGGITALVYRDVGALDFSFIFVVFSVALAFCAGILWEVIGWRAMHWPGNYLDLLPWPLGALSVGVAILAALGH